MSVLWPIIGGKPYVTEKTCEATTPIDGSVIAEIGICEKKDLDAAVSSAREAFASWRFSSKTERSAVLNKIADIIEANMDELAKNESVDTGKCVSESTLQLTNCTAIYRYFAAAALAAEDVLVQHPTGGFSAVIREPIGVAGLILPWNAPSMLMTWKLAPALAAGCCVVIKPSSNASFAVLRLAEKFQQVLPQGVLNVVTGSGSTIGQALLEHPGIDKLSFTGSTEVGKGVGVAAGNSVIPCTLELGGKSANIIFEDADLERAVQYAMIGSLSTAGEICVAGSRLLVQKSIYDKFVNMLCDKFKSVVVGDPMAEGTQMGPIIDKVQYEKVMSCIERGISDGAELLCGGHRVTGGICDSGYYIEPTLFGNVSNDMWIARNEIFGPVLCVIPFSTEEEAIAIANDSDYGLGAAVWTHDIYRAMNVSRRLEAGTVWVNDYLESGAGNPFGGYKKSGFGREIHKLAIENYTRVKNIAVSASTDVPPAY